MHGIVFFLILAALAIPPAAAHAQAQTGHPELERLMSDFVKGWREGDADLLSTVVAPAEGRLTWVSGDGADQKVEAMTFQAAMDRDRANEDYGLDGWRILDIDVVDDNLAFVKLEVLETSVVNIDYMVCYRVAGEWRIVSNTFAIRPR